MFMGIRYVLGASLGLWLIAGPMAAAGELADFNATVAKASAHMRLALSALQSGQAAQAKPEIEHAGKRWTALITRFGEARPDAFADNDLYAATLTDVGTRLATALIMIDTRRVDAAADALRPIRNALSQMRRASSLYLLADCLLDATTAMDALFVYKDNPPDWSKTDTRYEIAAKATIYANELHRCDSMAPGQTRADPQFRRVVEGALAGVALVPKAIMTRDNDLLSRILTELRSFDNLLQVRFG
jgi:hypothetical protein